jgi:NAD+ synthase (glutamine-hydrolysing)
MPPDRTVSCRPDFALLIYTAYFVERGQTTLNPDFMRLGLAQLNPTVGDLAGNRRKILDSLRRARRQGAELVVFPELAVCGYPPRDLLFKRRFVSDVAESLRLIAAATGAVPAVIGTVEANPSGRAARSTIPPPFATAAPCTAVGRKCLLPTYDVFDEDRYFEPAPSPTVVDHAGRPHRGHHLRRHLDAPDDQHPPALLRPHPVEQLADQKCDLMVNLSASPWHSAKENVRQNLVVGDAARSSVVPSSTSMPSAATMNSSSTAAATSRRPGPRHRRPRRLRRGNRVVDHPARRRAPPRLAAAACPVPCSPPVSAQDGDGDIYDALVLGLRDYAHKSGFKRALIALSGGIDSAVVAVLAAAAFGPENVIGVSLPSSISSQHSRDDARILAANLGIRFETIAIADAVAAAETALGPTFRRPRPRCDRGEHPGPRPRRVMMMALSNKFGSLLLTTGNKSEMAVGYCTLYGDMCGGLAVISDVFKTQVYALSRWINREREIIPENTIEKPPRRTAARPGRPGQPPALRRPRRDPERLRRRRPLPPRPRRPRLRRSGRQRRHPQSRPQRIQTKAGRARPENHPPRLRRRPPHPDRAEICELSSDLISYGLFPRRNKNTAAFWILSSFLAS